MSRYRDCNIIRVTENGKVTLSLGRRRFNTVADVSNNVVSHRIGSDNSLMSLSYEITSNPERWFVIADLNRDSVAHPLDIRSNTVLKVPTTEGFDLV